MIELLLVALALTLLIAWLGPRGAVDVGWFAVAFLFITVCWLITAMMYGIAWCFQKIARRA